MKYAVAGMVFLSLTLGTELSISYASDQPDFHMDCHAARTNNEQFICADEDLLRRDAQLGEISDKLYAVLDPLSRAEMAREFAEWLASRDDCEDNYFCNAGMYNDRMSYLQQELDHMDAPGIAQASAPAAADGFGLVPNAGIPGHNKETYPALTLEICKSICVQRAWCKSIDFDRTNGACYVQPVAEEDVGSLRTDYPGHPYDHYYYAPRLRN